MDFKKFKKIVIAIACGVLLMVVPTASAKECAPGAHQAFAQFADPSFYALLPNGGFESGKGAWTTTGGGAVVAGNEPFALSGKGASALSLPAGASATSPVFCIQPTTPTMRFVRRLAAGSSGTLRMEALIGGVAVSLGTLSATSTAWAPSPVVTMWPSTLAALAPKGAVDVQFRLTATAGSWLIDDVYLDPLKRVLR